MGANVKRQDIFEMGEVTRRIVGIRDFYLNKFLERKMYGLRPSVRAGKTRQRRRLFNAEDVYSIALVWLLFEAGLRPQPIKAILMSLSDSNTPDANLATRRLRRLNTRYVVIRLGARPLNQSKKALKPMVWAIAKRLELIELINKYPEAILSIVPVGNEFAQIDKRIMGLE
jgi:DNA-binding transcriptional MerR regulator